jgi:hypothetical protein
MSLRFAGGRVSGDTMRCERFTPAVRNLLNAVMSNSMRLPRIHIEARPEENEMGD